MHRTAGSLPEMKDALKARAARLKTEIPTIALALSHPETPRIVKILAAITVGYALSPIDLIPDFIPVLGYLDDLLLLPALAALTVRCIPESVLSECRENAAGMWENGKPKKWRYAIPILLFYAFLLFLFLRILF